MEQAPVVVVGLGDPVMDVVARVPASLLGALGAEPGGCIAVDAPAIEAARAAAAQHSDLLRMCGGSAANVLKGLANMSGGAAACKFMGMVGADATGAEYGRQLAAQGVQPLLLESTSGAPSATCLCLVTPDGQRTMRTCLGASGELRAAAQLPAGWAAGAALLHCEGYCLYRPGLARAAMEAAKKAGAAVSLDLASFELVRGCRRALGELLTAGLVDLVFCNEQEALALAEEGEEGADTAPAGADTGGGAAGGIAAAQAMVLRHAAVCVVSRGPAGCCARARSGEEAVAPARGVRVVDTIGAGDHFAAGFLWGHLQGCSLAQCCEAGCAAGGEAVQASGAQLAPEAWQRLRAQLAIIGRGQPVGKLQRPAEQAAAHRVQCVPACAAV